MNMLKRFVGSPVGPPLLMLVAAGAGLVWANLDHHSYERVFNRHLGAHLDGWGVEESLHGWINEGFMTLFFFAVGLEIKRELAVGELQDLRSAALPAIAALGGMAVPIAIYVAVNALVPGGDLAGWAIPVATDIAFTLGVLSLLGSRVPAHLRLFVLTLAIVDDIGGIVIIAVAFSEGLDLLALAGCAAVLVVIRLAYRAGLSRVAAYVPLGVLCWYLAWRAGLEPTIAGVAIGMLTPAGRVGDRNLLELLEHRLVPINALFVLPVFAVANTGILLDADSLRDAVSSPVSLGIALGLVVGKPLGITVATWGAVRSGIARLDPSVPPSLIAPAAALAGIGFTVALFISDLSFSTGSAHLREAKIAVLVASLIAACVGYRAFMVRARSGEATRPARASIT